MTQIQRRIFAATFGKSNFCITLRVLIALVTISSQAAAAQTFKVLYNFTDGADGGGPEAGLVTDGSGNLYGTTDFGGVQTGATQNGTVFRLTPSNGAWTLTTLHEFQGQAAKDGSVPQAPIAIGREGVLYGVTLYGGTQGCGIVFRLKPSTAGRYKYSILHSFAPGITDGCNPGSALTLDHSGNLFGTTQTGGAFYNVAGGAGTVFEVSPSGGEKVVWSFPTGNFGYFPVYSSVIFDRAGNLYGTTAFGGSTANNFCNIGGCGIVFQLVPSNKGWNENYLHWFNGSDGEDPEYGVALDEAGNIVGVSGAGGSLGCGTLFQLTPTGGSFDYSVQADVPNPCGVNGFTLHNGSIYVTLTFGGASGLGSIIKFTPSSGGWAYTDLHDFAGDLSEGIFPVGNPLVDADGNVFGTAAFYGPTNIGGTIWEITP